MYGNIRGLGSVLRPPAATLTAVCVCDTFHGCLLRMELTHHSRQKSAQEGALCLCLADVESPSDTSADKIRSCESLYQRDTN